MTPQPPLRPDGFRERGTTVTRLEAFVDAAFAFAVTLLVISLDTIPDSIDALYEALKGAPAFLASFAQLAMFWRAHVTWTRRYGLDDGMTLVLSLLLVFLALVYVYPLKVLFGVFFGWVSRGWLPANFEIESIGDLREMFIIYAGAFASLGLVIAAFYRHAWRKRAALGLSLREQVDTREEILAWLFCVLVAALSALLAVTLPTPTQRSFWNEIMLGLPGMAYSLLGLTGLLVGWYGKRVRAELVAAGATDPPVGVGPGRGFGTKRRRRGRTPRASA